MKNIMKKAYILGAFIAFALFLGAGVSSASAATSFNNMGNDCPTVGVANYNTNQGANIPCWATGGVTATGGQVINVRVYYHNTGAEGAYNTRVKLNLPTSAAQSNYSFVGSVGADNAPQVTGYGTVQVNPAASITFGVTRWYPNQQVGVNTPLPFGQTGAEIFSPAGLNLGTINPGWPAQGSVVVSFNVANAPPALCAINSFTANPISVPYGASSTLSWATSNCTNVSITNLGGVAQNGSQSTGALYSTTSYTLTAYGQSGSVSQTLTVSTGAAQLCQITNFWTTSPTINAGSSATLYWNTNNCISANISSIGSVPVNGFQSTGPLSATTTFILTAYNQSGVPTSQSVTVTVNQALCHINSFSASPTSVAYGTPTTLSWNTSNCTSANISNIGGVPVTGQQTTGSLFGTTTYVLTAYGSSGIPTTQSLTITLNQSQCQITNFWSTQQAVAQGASATLYWNTTGCQSATISTIGSVPVNGYQTSGPLYATTTFVLTAYGSTGSQVSQNVTVTVNQQACTITSFSASPTSVAMGSPSTLSWNTNGCTSANISNIGGVALSGSQSTGAIYGTTTYILTAYGQSGAPVTQNAVVSVNQSQCQITNFWSTSSSVNAGSSATLYWNTTGCQSATITNLGSVALNGSQSTGPIYATTTYVLTAYGSTGGQITQSVTISVNQAQCAITSFSASPTSVAQGSSATLSWNTSGCQSANITNLGSVPLTGSQSTGALYGTTTYVLTAYGSSGAPVSQNVTVSVNQQSCQITNFWSTSSTVNPGSSATLYWNTNGCQSVIISNLGSVALNGSQSTGPLYATTTFVLTAYSNAGSAVTQTVTISVNQAQCAITSFSANPTSVTAGSSSVLTWNTNGCQSANISNLGSVALSGSQSTGAIYGSTTYILTAYGQSGAPVTQSVVVSTNQQSCQITNFWSTSSNVNAGSSATLYWNSTGCTSANITNLGSVPVNGYQTTGPIYATTTYILTAYGSNGAQVTQSVTISVNQALCHINSFFASPTYVPYGTASTLYWNTNGCTSVTISGLGTVPVTGSQNSGPLYGNTTFIITAYGSNGAPVTQNASVTVY